MTILFFRWAPPARRRRGPDLPSNCEVRIWRPAADGWPASGPFLGENLIWFAFDRLGLFASREFEELTIWRGGRLLHRQIVTPRWLRFPFMAADDVQIGALWTAPEVRRTGFAAAAVAESLRRHARPGRSFWYLVDEENPASIHLAKACGFRLEGKGRRTSPLGVAIIGRFELDPRPNAA